MFDYSYPYIILCTQRGCYNLKKNTECFTLVDINAGGDFLGLCDQKSLYKHVSDFGRLRGYDRLNLRIEGNGY